MKILRLDRLVEVMGGVSCSCIQIYESSLIPSPISTIKNIGKCKSTCCVNEISRYMFEDKLYKCFDHQTDFNLTQAVPPTSEATKRLIASGEQTGRMVDSANILSSFFSLSKALGS